VLLNIYKEIVITRIGSILTIQWRWFYLLLLEELGHLDLLRVALVLGEGSIGHPTGVSTAGAF